VSLQVLDLSYLEDVLGHLKASRETLTAQFVSARGATINRSAHLRCSKSQIGNFDPADWNVLAGRAN